jgi:hypothetical protein
MYAGQADQVHLPAPDFRPNELSFYSSFKTISGRVGHRKPGCGLVAAYPCHHAAEKKPVSATCSSVDAGTVGGAVCMSLGAVSSSRPCLGFGSHQNPKTTQPLLRPHSNRPRSRCTPEERDEVAAGHSMTSSARSRIDVGTSRPSAFAVLRLMTSSNFVGCRTGNSAGLVPRRIRAVYMPMRRYTSVMLVP